MNNVTVPPAPVTVNYIFTLSAGGCSNTQTIPVVVNPKPVLSSTTTPAGICSGSPFVYTAAAALASNPTFAWSRPANGSINGNTSGSGTGANVNELLTNSTTQPVRCFIFLQLLMGLRVCVSIQQFVNVTVNPTPVATSTTLNFL